MLRGTSGGGLDQGRPSSGGFKGWVGARRGCSTGWLAPVESGIDPNDRLLLPGVVARYPLPRSLLHELGLSGEFRTALVVGLVTPLTVPTERLTGLAPVGAVTLSTAPAGERAAAGTGLGVQVTESITSLAPAGLLDPDVHSDLEEAGPYVGRDLLTPESELDARVGVGRVLAEQADNLAHTLCAELVQQVLL